MKDAVDGEPAQDDNSTLVASWKAQLESLTLAKARELYEENSNAFIALFKDLDEEMGKFDDVGEWLDALRDGNDGDPNCGIPLQSILSTSAALVRMHVVALQDPTLMLTVSEELLQRVLLLLQAIVLSKFCPADSDQSPPSAKRLHEILGAIPSMSTLLSAFSAFLEHVRPSGLLATLLLEICYAIIRSETYTGIPGIHTDHKLRPRLAALQSVACAVLVAVFQHHRGFRADIVVSVAQAVHSSFSIKGGLKLFAIPMTSSPDDVAYISAYTRVVLACSAITDPNEDSVVDGDLLSRYYRPGALFATELVQSSMRKEPSTVGLQSLSDFVDEVLLAVQTPEWLVGCVLLEQIVCKLLLQLSAMRNCFGGDQKRDLASIGQMIELLGSLAEKIHTMKVHLQPKKLTGELMTELSNSLASRWEAKKPSWLVPQTSSSSSRRRQANSAAAKAAAASATGNKAPLGVFVQRCQKLLQACADAAIIIDEVQEKAGVFPLPHQRYLEVSFGVFPTLPAALQMSPLLQNTTVHDLQFLELLRQCDKEYGAVAGSLRMNPTALLSQWVRSLQMRSHASEAAEVAALESQLNSLGLASQDSTGRTAAAGGERGEAQPPLDIATVQLYAKSVIYHTVLRELSEKIQELMAATLFDPSPLVRARVVKSLYRIVLTDPSMIHSEQGKENLARILRDKAISVREEGVRMVGVLLSDPVHRMNLELINELRCMMLDEGISVRKAVVNMFREILQCQPDHPAYQDISVSLLARMTYPKEEESIREAIRLIFQQIWFTAPSDSELQGMKRLLSMEVLPGSKLEATDEAANKSNAKGSMSSMHIAFTTRQLVKIVSVSSAVPSIEKLLQDLLHSRGEGNEVAQAVSSRRRSAQTYCERIVECLVDMLLSSEEELAKESASKEIAELRGHILATVAMFCEVHPPFVSPHILTFLPYLKRQTNSSAADVAIGKHVMKIVEATAVLQKNLLRSRAEEVIADLVDVVFTQGGAAVNAAISCICALVAHVTGDALPVVRIAEKCFFAVVAITKALSLPAASNTPALQPAQSAQLQRCLVVLGSICAHSKGISEILRAMNGANLSAKKWMQRNEEAAKRSLSQLTTLEPHLLTGTVYAIASQMFDLPDEHIRSRAVQVLCDVFTGNPRLMLVAQSTSLLQRMLARNNAEVIHERLISGLKQMLSSEEAAQEKNASLRQLHESGVQVVTPSKVFGPGDSDSDATIAGFVIQHHLDLITQFLSHPSATLRLSTLQLLGSLLRQGMVCPLDALASLVMLQCDRDEGLRSEALHLLVVQDERHPTFLDNRLREGVESAHDFQLSIFGDVRASYPLPSGDQAPYFGPLYTSCVQSNKRRWQGFVQALLRKCAMLAQNVASSMPSTMGGMHSLRTTQRVAQSALSQSLYLASVLASLPYQWMEEALFVLHLVHRNVPYDMSVCLAELKEMLLSQGALCSADDRLYSPHATGPGDSGDSSMPPPSLPSAPAARPGKKARTKPSADSALESLDSTLSAPPQPEVEAPPQPEAEALPPLPSPLRDEEKRKDLPRMLTQLAVLQSKEHLLRLKAYLKRIYMISDDRCALFDPSTKHVGPPERVQRVESSMAFQGTPPGAALADELMGRLCPSTALENEEVMCEEEEEVAVSVDVEVSIFQSVLAEYNRINYAVKNDPDDLKAIPRAKSTAKKSVSLVRKHSRVGRGKAEDPDEEYVSDSSSRSSTVSPSAEPAGSSTAVATRTSTRATKRPASYRYEDYVVGDEKEEEEERN